MICRGFDIREPFLCGRNKNGSLCVNWSQRHAGKSHNANSVMEDYGIELMIDDGLLIKDGKKMAGSSAKAEETTVAAVKRAIFHDPIHAGPCAGAHSTAPAAQKDTHSGHIRKDDRPHYSSAASACG